MRTRRASKIPSPLSLARRQFEQWRNRQQGRRRLPPEFWARAVTLAQAYGLNRTAQALGLKHESLQKHFERRATPSDSQKTEFLELLPHPMSPSPIECTLEWEDRHGVKMRMQVKGVGISDLVSFARLFRGSRA